MGTMQACPSDDDMSLFRPSATSLVRSGAAALTPPHTERKSCQQSPWSTLVSTGGAQWHFSSRVWSIPGEHTSFSTARIP